MVYAKLRPVRFLYPEWPDVGRFPLPLHSELTDSLSLRSYFEGEYAAISTNANDIYGSPADGRLTYPTVQSAVGEAAFMMGLERNSGTYPILSALVCTHASPPDIVFAASYAPLLGHATENQVCMKANSREPKLIRLTTVDTQSIGIRCRECVQVHELLRPTGQTGCVEP